MYSLRDRAVTEKKDPCLEEVVLIEKVSGLERLYDYYIKETSGNPIPFKKSDKVGLVLEVLGSSGGVYAWPPAWDYAKQMAPWLAYSFAITNPISNVLFLAKAMDDLFDRIQFELQVPDEIKDLIHLPTTRQLVFKYIKMGAGSIVCVIPFGVAVYLFPLPNCNDSICIGFTVTHSIISNAILHAVAWNLILAPQYWYYRLPVIPLEKLYSVLKKCFSSATKNELVLLEAEEEAIYDVYRKGLGQTFSSTAHHIVQGYLIDSSNVDLRAIQNADMSFNKFTELALKYQPAPVEAPLPPPSFFRRALSKTHSLFTHGGASFLGAGIMVVGCVGWIANPFYIGILEGLGLPASLVIGSLPSYSTGVLCAFYGTFVFSQIYSYMTTWTSVRDKFSLEAQMYPKTFALFLLINIYISAFAFASGAQLIRTVFSDPMWDSIRPTLEHFAIPTLELLSFIPLIELFNLVVRKSVAKFGNIENDHTLAARLLVKTPAVVHYLEHMKGEELIAALKKFDQPQLKALGVKIEQLETDLAALAVMEARKARLQAPVALYGGSGRRNAFFAQPTADSDGEKTPLIIQELRQ